MIIELNNNIDNDSLQIGDTAYYVSNISNDQGIKNTSDDFKTQKIGIISAIGVNTITVTSSSNVSQGDFLMFSKDKSVNNTSLLGYYAKVKLSNNSINEAELFALSSEITMSSK